MKQEKISCVWVDSIEGLTYQPSANVREWLTKPYVLSYVFKEVCKTFNVKILSQAFGMPLPEESGKLTKAEDKLQECAFIRQVYLQEDRLPLSFGRIVIPVSTYEQNFTRINQVGDNPFGETVLYSHPNLTRSPFEYSYISYGPLFHLIYEKIPKTIAHQGVWGRRSLFLLGALPLLVTEVFMPHLPVYPTKEVYDERTFSFS